MRTELRDYFREWIDLKNCALKNFSKYVKCKKKCSQSFNQIVIMEHTTDFCFNKKTNYLEAS